MVLAYSNTTTGQSLKPFFFLLCVFYKIDEQCTRNEGVNSNKIIRTYVGIATRIFTICGCILLLALITTMQRCFGVSNSKPDPRVTCADEYDRCSTVNSISFRPLEVWFNVVALLAAYEGQLITRVSPSSFPYSAYPMQWTVCGMRVLMSGRWKATITPHLHLGLYKRLALACGVTRKYRTVRGFTATSIIGLRALACGDPLHDLNHC